MEKMYRIFDSQAAFENLGSNFCESKMTWDYKQTLNKLTTCNSVTLMGVLDHNGIEENEEANKHAKQSAKTSFLKPKSRAHIRIP